MSRNSKPATVAQTHLDDAANEVKRAESIERAAAARLAELTREARQVEAERRVAPPKDRDRLDRKIAKLAQPLSDARQEHKDALRELLNVRFRLDQQRGEVVTVRRRVAAMAENLSRWMSSVGAEIAALERNAFNARDQLERQLAPLRRRQAELPQLIAAAAETEREAVAALARARTEADRVRFQRSSDEIMGEPVSAESDARQRAAAAGEAARQATVRWCELQRERFKVRTTIEAASKRLEGKAAEAERLADEKRSILRGGLADRKAELDRERTRLVLLCGSDDVELPELLRAGW